MSGERSGKTTFTVTIATIGTNEEKVIKTVKSVLAEVEKTEKQKSAEKLLRVEKYIIVGTFEPKKLLQLAESSPVKITYVKSEKGFSVQRNKAIELAEGDVVVFIDDASEVTEGWLKNIVAPLQEGWCAVQGPVFSSENDILSRAQEVLGFPGGGLKYFVRGEGEIEYFSTSNVALRRKCVVEAGGFDEKLKFGAEDTDLAERMRKRGCKFYYSCAPVVFTEPRKTLKDISAWFLRRGKAYFDFAKKHKKDVVRMMLIPKFLPALAFPPAFPFLLILYFAKNSISKRKEIYYLGDLKAFLYVPLTKLVADISFDAGIILQGASYLKARKYDKRR